jgi:hypothetical protein
MPLPEPVPELDLQQLYLPKLGPEIDPHFLRLNSPFLRAKDGLFGKDKFRHRSVTEATGGVF